MSQWDTVAVVGVGLIGGSIGSALRKRRLAREVVGIGRSQASLDVALARNAVTRTTLDLAEGVSRAEIVVVCTSVGLIPDHLIAAAKHARPGTLLTDAGSSKAQIVAAVHDRLPKDARFVGSHPIAGGEKSGPSQADPELFVGRVSVVTPAPDTPGDVVAEARNFWEALGARVVEMTPEAHDAALAASSHLPHIVASILSLVTPTNVLPLTAGGWRDTTRVAAGDPAMWTDILTANRDHILEAMQGYGRSWDKLIAALESNRRDEIESLFGQAKRNRDALGS